jgi:hypothetical protein
MAKHAPPPFSFARDWEGLDCFIIGGGTSVAPDVVHQIRHRSRGRAIVVNTSYLAFPWAPVLFFADARWWHREMAERPALLASYVDFPGHETYSIQSVDQRVRLIRRETHVGLSKDPTTVHLHTTSTTGALNIAAHRGARRIVLIGMDNRDGEVREDGSFRVHYHDEYPWRRKPETWSVKHTELKRAAADLQALGIEVINASLISTLDFWPRVDLAQWLKENPDV